MGREEASPCAKEPTLPPPGSRLVGLGGFGNSSFDAFCRDDGSSERLEAFDTQPKLEDDCNMSDDSGTMRQSSRTTSSQCGKPADESDSACSGATTTMGVIVREHYKGASPDMDQKKKSKREKRRRNNESKRNRKQEKKRTAELEGREKMESSDLMMSGAIQAQIELPTPTQAPPKRKNSDHSGEPGLNSHFTVVHRPKDAEMASHPPPKRQRRDLTNRSSPGPSHPTYALYLCRSCKRPHLAQRCISEQPQPTFINDGDGADPRFEK